MSLRRGMPVTSQWPIFITGLPPCPCFLARGAADVPERMCSTIGSLRERGTVRSMAQGGYGVFQAPRSLVLIVFDHQRVRQNSARVRDSGAKGRFRDFLMEGGGRGDVREGGREKTQNLDSRCWHLVISKRAVNGAPEFAVRGSLQRCSQPRLAAPDRSERCAVHSVETAAEDKGFGGFIAKCQRRDARRSQRIAAGLEIRVYLSCCALVYGGPSNFDFVGCEACQ